MKFEIFVALISSLILSHSYNLVEIWTDKVKIRRFSNVSLGLDDNENLAHQCNSSGNFRFKNELKEESTIKMLHYTPNRRLQSETLDDAINQKLQQGIVLVVGGHSDSYYNYGSSGSLNGLMAVWDSWVENFFSQTSNTTSLILLFDERDYLKHNLTYSKKEYLDLILISNMGARPVECAYLRQKQRLNSVLQPDFVTVKKKHQACNNQLHLDQGYSLYYVNVSSSNSLYPQQPLILFASIFKFPVPEWAQDQDEEVLFKTWKPFRLNKRYPTNYAYVKMTNWYSYHMTNLKILDFFDYGGKLDNDVSFVNKFPEPNLPKKLSTRGTKMLVTADGWYYDDPRIAQGVKQCLFSYIDTETKRCKNELIFQQNKAFKLSPVGLETSIFWESNLNATFRAHFLTFWLGLYTSPEVKSLAKYWNDVHPRGMWDYRWGDQQWWPRPIAVFGTGNVSGEVDHYNEINTENEKYVVHKLWPRYWTVPKTNYFFFQNNKTFTKSDRDEVYKISAKSFIK